MHRARSLLLVALAVIGGAVALPLRSSPGEEASPATRATGVVLRGYDTEGNAAWMVTAADGTIQADVGSLASPEIVFYKAGREALRARGETLVSAGKEAVLRGSVVISSDDGYRLETDELVWNQSADRLTARRVAIASEGVTVDAQEFLYLLNEDRWSVSGGFTATIDRPSLLRVVGKTLEGDGERLVLSGELSIEGEDETYSCERIDYERANEEVRLSGSVRGTLSWATLSADAITLTTAGSEATGVVRVVLEPGFFRGENGA